MEEFAKGVFKHSGYLSHNLRELIAVFLPVDSPSLVVLQGHMRLRIFFLLSYCRSHLHYKCECTTTPGHLKMPVFDAQSF